MQEQYKEFDLTVADGVERITRDGDVWHECRCVDANMQRLRDYVDDLEDRGVLLQCGDDCPQCGHTITTTNDGDSWRGEGFDLHCPVCHYMPDDV